MDVDKIGSFIKKLRNDKKMSQYDLADLIPIDRSVVSKWERGEVQPPIDKMKILCDIFDITIDELISGELKTKENEKEHQNNLFDYLIKQDTKYRKLKMFSIISVFVITILIFTFLIYYFLETHDTEKIYKIYGESENYVLKDGLLIITREKTYLKIGSINDSTYDIVLYYKNGDNKDIIYEGNSDLTLKDMHGYNASLNVLNFENMKDNLYMSIGDEEMKLYLTNDYKNDNYLLGDWNLVSDDSNDGSLKADIDKIKREFKCDNEACLKRSNDMEIKYLCEDEIIYIRDDDAKIQYDIPHRKFRYDSDNLDFYIENGNIDCEPNKCKFYKEIYDKYYIKIIKNYLR